MVFGASKDGDLLTSEGLKAMCEAEQELVRSHPKFSELTCYYCPDYLTLGTFVAILNQKQSCDEISDNDVTNTRQLLNRCAQYYIDGSLSQGVCNAPIPAECCAFGAVYSIFFYLAEEDYASVISNDLSAKLRYVAHFLPVSYHREINEEPLKAIYVDRFHRNPYQNGQVTLRALDFGGNFKFKVFNSFLFRDFAYLAIGLFSVIFVLWIYTKSLLISIATFVIFILSFLLSFFLYFVVFRRTFFPVCECHLHCYVVGSRCRRHVCLF